MECRFRFVCSVFVGCNYDTGKQDVILCTNFKGKICGKAGLLELFALSLGILCLPSLGCIDVYMESCIFP